MGPDALQECYRRYQRELYLYLRTLCASAPLAEDLLQETFLRALLALPEAHTNIRAWLYRVARNLALDHLHRARGPEPPLPESQADDSPGPLEQLLEDERRRLLYQALSHLEPRKREILELQYFSGLSQREIGALLDLKPEYVRVLALRPRRDLRIWMEERDYDLS